MNLYEHTIIARQDTSPSEIKQLTDKYSKIIEKNEGEVVKTENWGLLNHQKGYVWKMSSNNKNISIENSVMFTPNGPKPCKELSITLNLEKIRAYKSISCNWAFELQK